MQGKSPPVQVKEPYGNLDVQGTHAYNTQKRVRQYIKKERKAVCCFTTRDCQMRR